MQTPRSCEEQVTSHTQFCQINLRSSKFPKGVPLPFSTHINSNTQLPQFFLFMLFSAIILTGLHVRFGLAHINAEVSTSEEPLRDQRRWQHTETLQSTWLWQGVRSAAVMLASGPDLQCLKQPRLPEKTNYPVPSS